MAVVQAAARATGAEHSAHVVGTLESQLSGATSSGASGTGSGGFSGSLVGDIQTKPLAGRITISHLSVGGQSPLSGGMTELITSNAFYMKIPALASQLGKPWIKVTYQDLQSQSGISFKQLISQAEQMQPGQYVAQLAAAGNLRKVGTATIDGVATTHYTGFVPIAQELKHYSPSLRQQMQQLLHEAGFKGATVDVWLDGQGLARRTQSVAKSSKGSFAVKMDISHYGEKVIVTPPPAGQTADIGKLMQQQGTTQQGTTG